MHTGVGRKTLSFLVFSYEYGPFMILFVLLYFLQLLASLALGHSEKFMVACVSRLLGFRNGISQDVAKTSQTVGKASQTAAKS